MLCILSYEFYFISNKFSDDLKKKLHLLLKAHDTLKFVQDVALNHIIEKGKPQ